jgi:hypothetical protein
MTQHDYEFRVTLSRDRVGCQYDAPGKPNCDLGDANIHREHLETIVLLEEWLKRWEWIARNQDEHLLVPDTFRVLGNRLWDMALSEVPGQDLIDAIDEVRRSQARPRPTVRVRMSFATDASDLIALPWEFMHLPGDRTFFLAAETSLTLGRYLDGQALFDAEYRSADNKLRVLFLVILPKGTDFDDERRAIDQLLNKLSPKCEFAEDGKLLTQPSTMQLMFHDGWDQKKVASTLAKFADGPDGGPVDVVHLTALFRRRERDRQLYLPDGSGDWGWTDAMPVVGALTGDPDNRPKLVILHLCDWHKSDQHTGWDQRPEHFEQLAPEFIRQEVPAVLAMQYPMHPMHGWEFVTNLYQRLAKGENIGAAVQAARRDLAQRGRRDRYFGTPVLYMQSRVDGGLVTQIAAGDGNRERRPSARRPTVESRPPSRALVFELAQLVDDITPGTATTADLADWIQQQTWPTAVTTLADRQQADNVIRLRRKLAADPAADEILSRLLRRVRELADQGGGR